MKSKPDHNRQALGDVPQESSAVVRRNRRYCLVWCLAGVTVLAFAFLPSFLLVIKGKPQNFDWKTVVALAVFALPFGTLGMCLLFYGVCRIQLSGHGGEICRRKSFGPISFRKYFQTVHVSLTDKIVARKRGLQVHEVLYAYDEREAGKILLWDLECANLYEVGTAIASTVNCRFTDRRDQPISTSVEATEDDSHPRL